jgi:hypothetical protein
VRQVSSCFKEVLLPPTEPLLEELESAVRAAAVAGESGTRFLQILQRLAERLSHDFGTAQVKLVKEESVFGRPNKRYDLSHFLIPSFDL